MGSSADLLVQPWAALLIGSITCFIKNNVHHSFQEFQWLKVCSYFMCKIILTLKSCRKVVTNFSLCVSVFQFVCSIFKKYRRNKNQLQSRCCRYNFIVICTE